MDNSELMAMSVISMLSLASEVEILQSDSSAMSLEAKLMSGVVDRPYVALFSIRMV